ncbi:protein NLRC3-like [Orbicella faveolata]|uniref:protein NLRC3-like n=1 Tax=Orbicella faveolata TaxID=48498 RepID=UPI0009E25033|nr:protein NLRC3-like [Orbicella faveolata]
MSLSKVQNGQVTKVRYTKESANFSRLAALVISVGTLALKTQFNEIYSPGVLHHVLGYETVLNDLQNLQKEKRISATQWTKLYPAVRESVSADTFDISLLMVLIRNICCLPAPPAGWDKLPSSEDTTLSADITRVSYFRRELAHASEASIDNETFEDYWKILSEALVRLLGESRRPDLDHLKESTLNPSMGDYYNACLEDKGEEEKEQKTGGDDCASSIAEALLSNGSLTTYGCSGKNVGDGGAESFAKVLVENKTLTELDLSNNKIGNRGACLIASALEENVTLKNLNLSKNRIGDEGAIALANALKVNKTLAELDMSNNKYGSDVITQFSEVVKTSTTITKLAN